MSNAQRPQAPVALTLRDAEYADWPLLLRWRNDPDTRKNSHNQAPVEQNQHCQWLTNSLNNPDRLLFIAMMQDNAVGTVRADRVKTLTAVSKAPISQANNSIDHHATPSVWLLSWTVNPDFRGQGIAKQMVALLAQRLDGCELRAEIRDGNKASVKVARHIGMEPIAQVDDSVADDFVIYARHPQSSQTNESR